MFFPQQFEHTSLTNEVLIRAMHPILATVLYNLPLSVSSFKHNDYSQMRFKPQRLIYFPHFYSCLYLHRFHIYVAWTVFISS